MRKPIAISALLVIASIGLSSGVAASPSANPSVPACENDKCMAMTYCEHFSNSNTGCNHVGFGVPCETYECRVE